MNQHALIIGVEAYRDPAITPVRFARADAAGLAAAFREQCGFGHVRVLAGAPGDPDEPSTDHIIDALLEFSDAVQEGDHFVLVFSGHGMEVDGHGLLLVADSRGAVPEAKSLPLKVLWRFLEQMPARWCTVILDSCRNDPMAGKGEGDAVLSDGFYRDLRGLGQSRAKARRITSLLTACEPGKRAFAWEGFGHGVCTHFLLQGLKEHAWKQGRLTFQALAAYACDEVSRWSSAAPGIRQPQHPRYERWGSADEVTLGRKESADPVPVEAHVAEDVADPLPPGAWGWFQGAPAYRSRIATHCRPVIRIEGLEMDCADAPWLVRRGVAEVTLREGGLIGSASVESLIAGRQTGLLRRWVDSLPVIDVLADAVRSFLEDDIPAFAERIHGLANASRRLVLRMLVRQFMDPSLPASREADEAWADQRMRPALAPLFGRMWKRSKRVPEWIRSWMARTPASGVLADEWIQKTELAAASLEGGVVVAEMTQQSTLLARSCRERVAVARIHARYLGELVEAREILQAAEATAERTGSSEDWSRCAVAWLELFAEPLAARRCAQRAEDAVMGARDWRWVARARAAALLEGSVVRDAVQRGALLSSRSGDRVAFAEEFWLLLRDREGTRQCLASAQEAALDAVEWGQVGVVWDRLLGESTKGSECLSKAGMEAASTFDWQACARASHEIGAATEFVVDCVDRSFQAAHASRDAQDWCVVASVTRELLGSDEQADGFLLEASRVARGLDDWLACARIAATPDSAAGFLRHAQERATRIEDHRTCAEAWIRHGRDLVEAQRCLLRAEQQCLNDDDWVDCARAWEDLFRDAEAGRRCREKCDVPPPPPDPDLTVTQTQIQ
jgi:Caspase domain